MMEFSQRSYTNTMEKLAPRTMKSLLASMQVNSTVMAVKARCARCAFCGNCFKMKSNGANSHSSGRTLGRESMLRSAIREVLVMLGSVGGFSVWSSWLSVGICPSGVRFCVVSKSAILFSSDKVT